MAGAGDDGRAAERDADRQRERDRREQHMPSSNERSAVTAPPSEIAARQAPLRRRYSEDPRAALIVDRGRTTDGALGDPVHTTARPGDEYPAERVDIAVGTHRGVGGLHDAPNPGELLCATLAACQDSTVRMVANLLGVRLTMLTVEVEGDVDLRGTLAVDRSVRVGFQAMRLRCRLGVAPATPPDAVELLLAAAERSCVVLDTLRHGVDVAGEFRVASRHPCA
jgi:uncharacterized OsmC-like protein